MTSSRKSFRRHGRPPFSVVVVHGGPGAPGSLAPLARALADIRGVLEPRQSARTVRGLVEELSDQVDRGANPPVVLVGHSWGAWLALLLAARYPEKVRRLILVGSAPFRTGDVRALRRVRRGRLGPSGWREFRAIERRLSSPRARATPADLRRLGALSERADSYRLLPRRTVTTREDPRAYREVWGEASEMRRNGSLLRAVRGVVAPVLVVHGRDDPHPVQGVVGPLRRRGVSVRVVLLDRCGHEPWRERYGRGPFLSTLRRELVLP